MRTVRLRRAGLLFLPLVPTSKPDKPPNLRTTVHVLFAPEVQLYNLSPLVPLSTTEKKTSQCLTTSTSPG